MRMLINKLKIFVIFFIFVFSSYAYSKDFNTVEEINDHLETCFHSMLSKLDNSIISKDISKNIILDKIETNGIVIHLDHYGNIIEDVRNKYDPIDYYALAVNRSKMVLTVYRYNPEKFEFNIPLVSFPISCNYTRTPLGTHRTTDKYRWHTLFGGHYGQYCTRYSKNLLFHSALYSTPSNIYLETETYNGILYKLQSGGCIRLRTQDAKWIYDNVPYSSLVVVYDGVEESPFKRPVFDTIDITFDPTDKGG